MHKLLLFWLVLFVSASFVPVQAATPSAPVSFAEKELSNPSVQKFKKRFQKKLKKQPRSNFAGLEAYGYIMMFFLVMILMAIGLILSLVFQWTIAAWIFGIIFGLQFLICLTFLISLL